MTESSQPRWQVPVLARQGRLVAGVARGIADELGIDPIIVRLSFVVLTAAGGWGAILYGVCWVVFALHAVRHQGPRSDSLPKGRNETERTLAVVLLVAGVLLVIKDLGLGFSDAVVWPVVLLAGGALLAWRRTVIDVAENIRSRTWQIVLGGLLMLASLVLIIQLNLSLNLDLQATLGTFAILGLLTLGGVLLFGPLGYRLWRELMAERRLRIRSEEKADMAAHLHDSVLQTLTLMQNSSDDQQRVAALARQQERELREWLYGEEAPTSGRTLRAELNRAAADIEQLHGVPIEVVVVGDAELDRNLDALLGAAREAMTNAVRHSGAAVVDVYAELRAGELELFVRDRGHGFESTKIPDDRRGIAQSIVARMQRAGGEATITSKPGEGTEIELRLNVTSAQSEKGSEQ